MKDDALQRTNVSEDPYRTLDVSKDATDAEIKRSYRKLARQYHPDRNPGDAAAEERFKSIQSAYEEIGTAEARSNHDQQKRMEEMFSRGGEAPHSGAQIWETYSHSFLEAGGEKLRDSISILKEITRAVKKATKLQGVRISRQASIFL